MTGKFIVIEGIDGSGTSTQANILKSYFINQGKKAINTCEPTDGEIGKLIRKALQQDIFSLPDDYKFDQQMAILFAADRYYHLFNQVDGILVNLAKDIHVISTRYFFSSIAYNANSNNDFEWIQELNSKFPLPDVLIYINTPVEVSLERIAKRKYLEVYEQQEKLSKVSANYAQILENYPGLLVNIDGSEPIEKVHKNIVQFLEKII